MCVLFLKYVIQVNDNAIPSVSPVLRKKWAKLCDGLGA